MIYEEQTQAFLNQEEGEEKTPEGETPEGETPEA